MEEIWEEIDDEGRYEVSNLGRVMSWRGDTRILKPRLNTKGYWIVDLFINKIRHTRLIHRLVAEAFIGDVPDGYQVIHKDGNKYNNRPDNLEFATPQQIRYKQLGIKITKQDIEDIRQAYNKGDTSYMKLSKLYNVSHVTISRIVNRKGAYRHK